MAEATTTINRPSLKLALASALAPLGLLAGLIYLFFARGTGIEKVAPAPLERLSIERVIFRPGEIRVQVLNDGPGPATIAQVQVGWFSRASWEFAVTPSPTIPRLGTAMVRIPYPWVEGEPYEIVLITSKGLLFTHEVKIATATPAVTADLVGSFSLVGLYVGVIPVFLGMLWLPFLRRLSARWYGFLLSLTLGLLVFLGVEALAEALESAEKVPSVYQGVGLVTIGFSLAILVLLGVSRHARVAAANSPERQALLLAYLVAFGIGVHNLGEGLAIGGAYALGEIGMGAMLVLGFTIHNLTEGIAIVAPVVQSRFRWIHLLYLGLLAGAPTILGTCLGAFTYSAVWAVLFLAIGAGAVFQVVMEIVASLAKESLQALATVHNVAGFLVGLAVMYLTGLLVTV